jgi:hypothetical protein
MATELRKHLARMSDFAPEILNERRANDEAEFARARQADRELEARAARKAKGGADFVVVVGKAAELPFPTFEAAAGALAEMQKKGSKAEVALVLDNGRLNFCFGDLAPTKKGVSN